MILWVVAKSISHRFETKGTHGFLVVTGIIPGFLRWCLRGFRPSTGSAKIRRAFHGAKPQSEMHGHSRTRAFDTR